MEDFRMGFFREDITPAVGGNLYGYAPDVFSNCVNDRLTVDAAAFASGEETLILVSASVCLIHTELADEIRRKISKETGVPKENILLTATHTHSGPNTRGQIGWGDIDREYCEEIFVPSCVSAANEACKRVVPAIMAVGVTDSLAGINRREMRDGNLVLGQDPEGSMDKKMTILSFKTADGDMIANIIHYCAHGTSAGRNTEISRDWPGVMIDCLEKETSAPAFFLNGTEGDVGPRLSNGQTVGDITYVAEVGKIAGEDAIKAFYSLGEYYRPEVACAKGCLQLPLKERIPLEDAKTMLAEIEAGGNVNLNGFRISYLKSVIQSYETEYQPKEHLSIPQSVFKLGTVIMVPFGFETFSGIGLALREKSNCPHLLCVGPANGSYGYLPVKEELKRGGYEVVMFLTETFGTAQTLADNTDENIVNENLKIINELLPCIE